MDTVVPRRNFALLNMVVLGGVGIYGLHAVMRYLEHWLVLNLSQGVVNEIRRDVFRYQLSLPLTYFQKMTPGKLISKVTYSVNSIKMLIESFAYVCLREITVMTAVVVTALVIDYRLAILFLGLSLLFILYIRSLHRVMADLAGSMQTKNDQIMKILDRSYNSITKGPDRTALRGGWFAFPRVHRHRAWSGEGRFRHGGSVGGEGSLRAEDGGFHQRTRSQNGGGKARQSQRLPRYGASSEAIEGLSGPQQLSCRRAF